MKVFIITLAVIVLYTFTIIFTQDYRQAQRNSYRVKYACEELSATAATFYDREQYSEGYTVFDTGQGIRSMEDQLTNLLSVDDSGNPIPGSYWSDALHYRVYFYDDLLERKEYTDGSLTGTGSFSYPYSHNDEWTGYNTIITCPTVIVTINAGIGKFRLNFLDSLPNMVRSASHEWEDR